MLNSVSEIFNHILPSCSSPTFSITCSRSRRVVNNVVYSKLGMSWWSKEPPSALIKGGVSLAKLWMWKQGLKNKAMVEFFNNFYGVFIWYCALCLNSTLAIFDENILGNSLHHLQTEEGRFPPQCVYKFDEGHGLWLQLRKTKKTLINLIK